MTTLREPAKSTARRVRAAAVWSVVVMVLLSTFTVQGAVAQETGLVDDGTYVLETGQTVTWSGAWAFDPEFSGAEQDVETVFLGTQLGTVMIMTLPPDLDVEGVRDEVLGALFGGFDDATTLDRGAYQDLSYSLDMLTLEGLDFGTFVLFRAGSGDTPTFVTFFMAPVEAFAAQFADAQESIQIDGAAIFNGVGGEGLQDLLEANAGGSADAPDDGDGGDAAETPADESADGADEDPATPTADEDSGNGDRGKLGIGDNADEDQPEEDQPEEDQPEEDQPAPSGETGLIDDNTFVSPLYGVETTWSGAWILDPERDPNVIENGENGVDFVALQWTGDGPAFLSATYISAGEATDVTPIMDLWTSDDFLADAIASPDGGIVMADNSATVGAVIYLDFTTDDVPVVYYREVHYLAEQNAFVLLTFYTVPQLIEASVGDAQDGVTINGEPALAFFSVEEILDEFA